MANGEYVPNLKPCPFCGGPASHGTEVEDNSNGPDSYLVGVGCQECGISMKSYVQRHVGAHDMFLRESGKRDWSEWFALPEGDQRYWHMRSDNRNASYDIEGYKELEERWNRRT